MRRLVRRCGVTLLLGGAACAASGQPGPESILGTWRGQAVFRGKSLAFAVRFARAGDTLRGTFSSADLLILDQPLDAVRYRASQVYFSTQDENPIRFHGALRGDSIYGAAGVPAVPGVVESHAGAAATPLQFELRRAPAPGVPPYATREVRFSNAGVNLAGTLLMPPSAGNRHAGIIILQGSTSNLRREYRFYADHFARAGLAVLTFDKRGTGESSGNYDAATYDDLAADAVAAVEFLRGQAGVDPKRVGVWGLSQGAFIAPLVARRLGSLAFIAAVSPPGVMVGESAAYQDSLRLMAKGYSSASAGRAARLNRQILAWLATGGARAELDDALTNAADLPWRRASSLPERLPADSALEGWYWRGRTLDPIPLWRSLRAPVLVVFGSGDELVPAVVSADRIRRALREGGNRDATVRVFPAANHVLRQLPLVAGGEWDWPRAAPGYLETLTAWVLGHTR